VRADAIAPARPTAAGWVSARQRFAASQTRPAPHWVGSYPEPVDLEFSGEIWCWKGTSPWHLITVPEADCAVLDATSALVSWLWVIPVTAQVGATRCTTSLMLSRGLDHSSMVMGWPAALILRPALLRRLREWAGPWSSGSRHKRGNEISVESGGESLEDADGLHRAAGFEPGYADWVTGPGAHRSAVRLAIGRTDSTGGQ
jgi:Domain of unknown function (DUF1905)